MHGVLKCFTFIFFYVIIYKKNEVLLMSDFIILLSYIIEKYPFLFSFLSFISSLILSLFSLLLLLLCFKLLKDLKK